jgi:hypothetical protein
LTEYGCANKECAHEETITNSDVTFLQIRDFLISSGEIFHEDTENNVYVASLRSGLFGMNRTVVALQIRGSKVNVAGFAKEGAIKQESWKKAFAKIEAFCQGNKANEKKPKSKVCSVFSAGSVARQSSCSSSLPDRIPFLWAYHPSSGNSYDRQLPDPPL